MVSMVASINTASAEVLREHPQIFDPITRFMYQEVGTIIASREQIVFPGGAKLQLTFIEENSSGEWPVIPTGVAAAARIFEADGDIPRLKGGKSICGDGKPVTFVAVWPDIDPTNSRRAEAKFNFYSSDTAPVTDKSDGWCLTLITYAGNPYQGPTYDGTEWSEPLGQTEQNERSLPASSDVAAGAVVQEPAAAPIESQSEKRDFSSLITRISGDVLRALVPLLALVGAIFLAFRLLSAWKVRNIRPKATRAEHKPSPSSTAWARAPKGGLVLVLVLIAGYLAWSGSSGMSAKQPDFVEVRDDWAEGVLSGRVIESTEWPGIYLEFTCLDLGQHGKRFEMQFSTVHNDRLRHDTSTRLRRHEPEEKTVVEIGVDKNTFAYGKLSSVDYSGREATQPQLRILAELLSKGYIDITAEGKTARFYADAELEDFRYGLGCLG